MRGGRYQPAVVVVVTVLLLLPLLACAAAPTPSAVNADAAIMSCELRLEGGVLCENGLFYYPARQQGSHSTDDPGHSPEQECVLDKAEFGSAEFWESVAASAALVCSGGLFSGLTIGLMSLDLDELRMIEMAPVDPQNPKNKENAARIIPLLKDQHLLLVTLLLCNAAAMEALPIFLDEICPNQVVTILVSLTLVLFFGEVIPQALCNAYGLTIGATMVPVVKGMICMIYIIAKPISSVLDLMFGHEIKTLRRVDWIGVLAPCSLLSCWLFIYALTAAGDCYGSYPAARLDLMAESANVDHDITAIGSMGRSGGTPVAAGGGADSGSDVPLTRDEVTFMKGVLGMFDTKVSDRKITQPIDRVFSLFDDECLTAAKLQTIRDSGYSRIPIFQRPQRTHACGILLVKNLITATPQRISTLLLESQTATTAQQRQKRERATDRKQPISNVKAVPVLHGNQIPCVHQDISMFALIDLFSASKTQMALVYAYDPDNFLLESQIQRQPQRMPVSQATESDSCDGDRSEPTLQPAYHGQTTAALRAAYELGFVLQSVDSQNRHAGSAACAAPFGLLQLVGLTTLQDLVTEIFGTRFASAQQQFLQDPVTAATIQSADDALMRSRMSSLMLMSSSPSPSRTTATFQRQYHSRTSNLLINSGGSGGSPAGGGGENYSMSLGGRRTPTAVRASLLKMGSESCRPRSDETVLHENCDGTAAKTGAAATSPPPSRSRHLARSIGGGRHTPHAGDDDLGAPLLEEGHSLSRAESDSLSFERRPLRQVRVNVVPSELVKLPVKAAGDDVKGAPGDQQGTHRVECEVRSVQELANVLQTELRLQCPISVLVLDEDFDDAFRLQQNFVLLQDVEDLPAEAHIKLMPRCSFG